MIEKIGGNVKRKQSTSNTLTEPMCRCELTPACLNNPNDLTRIRKKGHTWSEVGDRRGAHAETMPTAEDRSCLRSTADRRRHSITFDLFRGLVILFMRKLKVRLTLYFSDSDLAGMMYSSHSSSWILQRKDPVTRLYRTEGAQRTAWACLYGHLYGRDYILL